MTFAMRVIRSNRWAVAEERFPWLSPLDIIADPMADFATSKGTLSFFIIDKDRSNFERVVAAMAANRESIDHFDYGLIKLAKLEKIFKLIPTDGGTPDEVVDKMHRDMVELSAKNVVKLTKIFFQHSERDRRTKNEIEALLYKYKANFDPKKIKSKKIKEFLGFA